jgi:catechol 2,3-dioxygenase-like lactoylglutathione lyase family enzyme
MPASIKALDHWAIATRDERRCIAFYKGILGLKVGPRPKLTFQGVWFYSGDKPIVHVTSGCVRPRTNGCFRSHRFRDGGLPHGYGEEAARQRD